MENSDKKEIDVRRATLGDIPLINEMAQNIFPHTYGDILTPEQIDYMMEWMYAPHNLEKQMRDEGQVYFIGYINNSPFGYLSVQQEEEDLFHLQKIYVLSHFQGKGLGKLLFQQAIDYIKSVHPAPCKMILNVNRDNKAKQFYERLGMKVHSVGDFPIGNGYYMNDYIMELSL